MKFYFKDGLRSTRDRAYQVTRSEFDKLLLDHSRENGAEVREETEVRKIDFFPDRVRLETSSSQHSTTPPPQSSPTPLEARYLLDCSGRQTVLGSMFKLKKTYDHLQKFSVFAHYDNVDRPPGIDGTLIRMVRGIDRWFWMIPLTATRTSIGVVMDTSAFRAMKLSPEKALEECINQQPIMLQRMENATRVSPVYSAGDYSYRNSTLFGDRWLLAGDAAGFIDPVFSSGVFLGIMSAEKAADALHAVLDNESVKSRRFREYSRRIHRVMDMYLTFVNSWYSGKEFVEVFLNPGAAPHIAAAVNAVLAGNEGKSWPIKWRMWVFYFFVRAQKFVSFSPRLSLVPKTSEAARAI
jgi:flavin-dependent dehydrogenase